MCIEVKVHGQVWCLHGNAMVVYPNTNVVCADVLYFVQLYNAQFPLSLPGAAGELLLH
jgi:hypothetical protein